MADTKISALTALTGANVDAAADVFAIVDTDVTTTKKIVVNEAKIALGMTSSSFTASLTGCTTVPTVTATYSVTNGVVTVFYPPVTATSNTTALTLTGQPAAIQPVTAHGCFGAIVQDNGTNVFGRADIGTNGVVTFNVGVGSVFTGSGTKGVPGGITITYNLT